MRIQIPEELIERAKNGERGEIEALLSAVWPDVYRFTKAVLPYGDCAEDAAQDACVAMYRTIGSLRDVRAFGTWLYRIAVREALKQKKHVFETDPLQEHAAREDDPSRDIDLERALCALPQHLRTVIVLHYFEDLPSREIAAILHVPDATVRFRLMTARRKLQPLLEERGTSADLKGEEIYAL